MIVVIDNYDSFVHNLARYLVRLGQTVQVVRNDEVDAEGLEQLRPSAIVLSPGPSTPDQAGCCLEVVRCLGPRIPLLGVCLGHQAIAAACGARVVPGPPCHGRASLMRHQQPPLLAGLPSPLKVGRYHSLLVEPNSLPDCLHATAFTEDGILMALEHRTFPLFGVQFHPESILTEGGYAMLANFLAIAGLKSHGCPARLAADEQSGPPTNGPATSDATNRAAGAADLAAALPPGVTF